MRYKGKVWRHVPAGAHPLHAGYILRAGGRWNRQGVYGCLYTSLTKRGALAEFAKFFHNLSDVDFQRWNRDLVSIFVDLDPVADLTNKATSPIPPDEPLVTGNDPSDFEACRALADSLRAAGYVALITPSAARPGEKNLDIYLDGLAGNIHIDEGGERIPLEAP